MVCLQLLEARHVIDSTTLLSTSTPDVLTEEVEEKIDSHDEFRMQYCMYIGGTLRHL